MAIENPDRHARNDAQNSFLNRDHFSKMNRFAIAETQVCYFEGYGLFFLFHW